MINDSGDKMKIEGSSEEYQLPAIKRLITDQYSLARCSDVIKERFFEDVQFRLIYKAALKHYNKYYALPSKQELISSINSLYNPEYGDKKDVFAALKGVMDWEPSSEKYLEDGLNCFIQRSRIEDAILDLMDDIKSGTIDLEKINNKFYESTTTRVIRKSYDIMSDPTKWKEIREDAMGTDEHPIKVKFFIEMVNKAMEGYGSLVPGTVNMIVAPPGRGKTTLLINQGIQCARDGMKSLHIFLGDMTRYDARCRYISCLSGIPTGEILPLSDDQKGDLTRKYNMTGILANAHSACYAADELNATQLIEEVKAIQNELKIHYAQIIIDYDENLSKDDDNIYESGGSVYNKIARFARENKSVIFIAAQPKPEYWKKEIIPLAAAAESSKKQKIIDLMLTLGKPNDSSSVGTLFIAKNRRGRDCQYTRLSIDGSTARMEQISNDEYERLKAIERSNARTTSTECNE